MAVRQSCILPAHEWVRVNVLRRPPTLSRVTASRATVWAVSDLKASGVVWPASDAAVAAQVEYLQREVMALHERIAAERREVDDKVRAVNDTLTARIGKVEAATSETAEAVRSLATDSVRWEVVGLLCVGLWAQPSRSCPRCSAGSRLARPGAVPAPGGHALSLMPSHAASGAWRAEWPQ